MDTKIKRLIRKYGVQGYGLYNYFLEIIAFKLSPEKPVPEVEEECRDIAEELKMDTLLVEEIIQFCIKEGLFQIDKKTNRVLCLKLLHHLDNHLSRNPEIRKIINNFNMLQKINHDQYIYIIKGMEYYKIGKSKNVDRRLKEFKVAIPYKIELYSKISVSDMDDAEKALHTKYENNRIEGEWFKLDNTSINKMLEFLILNYNGKIEYLREPYVVHTKTLKADQTRLDQTRLEEDINQILNYWNSKAIYIHCEEVVEKNIHKKHTDIIELYGIEKIKQAINLYSQVFKGDKYYWTHRWSLWDFICRGISKFVPEADPLNNFLIDKNNKIQQPRSKEYICKCGYKSNDSGAVCPKCGEDKK